MRNLSEFSSTKKSNWSRKAEYRAANRGWLLRSANISIQIANELEGRKMSQTDLANLVNVTPQYISKIIKGEENLSLETIDKIERALKIKLDISPLVYVETKKVNINIPKSDCVHYTITGASKKSSHEQKVELSALVDEYCSGGKKGVPPVLIKEDQLS